MIKSVRKLVSSVALLALGIALDTTVLKAAESCTAAKQDCEMNDGHEFRFDTCGEFFAVYGCYPEWPGETEFVFTCVIDSVCHS